MDQEKVREVLATYKKKFEELKVEKKKLPKEMFGSKYTPVYVMSHCHAMLDEMEIFIQEGRMDKVFRWLGFIQGCLWTEGVYSLDDLMNQNRPRE